MAYTVDAAMEKHFIDLANAEPFKFHFEIHKPANQFPFQVTPAKMVMTAAGHLDVQIKNSTKTGFRLNISIHSFCFVITRIWLTKKNGKEEDINKYWRSDDIQHDFTKGRNVFNVRIAFAKDIDPMKRLSSTFENIEGFLEISSDFIIDRYINTNGCDVPPQHFHLMTTRRYELSIDFENERILEIKQLLSEYHKNSKRMERIKGIQSDEEKANKRWQAELEKKKKLGNMMTFQEKSDNSSEYWSTYNRYDWDNLNQEVLRSIWKTMDSLSDDEIMKIKKEKKVELEIKKKEKEKSEENDRKREEEERKKKKRKCCVIV